MRHECAVGTVQLERAAKSLVGIPEHWLTAPQFRRAPVEFLDDSSGVAGIDGDGTQVEQGPIALFIPARNSVA